MMGLGVFKKYDFVFVKVFVENLSYVNDVGVDVFGVGQQIVGNFVWIDSVMVVDFYQDLVFLVQRGFDFLMQD